LTGISWAGVGDPAKHTAIIEYPAGSDKVYAVRYGRRKIQVFNINL